MSREAFQARPEDRVLEHTLSKGTRDVFDSVGIAKRASTTTLQGKVDAVAQDGDKCFRALRVFGEDYQVKVVAP